MLHRYMKSVLGYVAIAFVLMLCACTSVEPEAPVSFEPLASIPVGRASAVSFSVGGKGYVLGGRTTTRGGYLNDFWMYDPLHNEWIQLPDAPFKARVNAVAQVCGDKVFVGLGYNGGGVYDTTSYQRDWWMYDTQSGEWERRADYPTYETAGASAFAVGDDIMVCFGYYDHATNHVYAYNVPDNKWRRIDASACSGKEESIAGSVGGRYFVGTCARWYEYIATDGRWVTRSVIPNETSRLCAGAVTVSGSLFMIGGRVAWQDIKVYDEVWEYTVDADRWRLRGYTPNGGRENLVAFEIGGTAYVGLGENEDGEVLDDFYKMVIP